MFVFCLKSNNEIVGIDTDVKYQNNGYPIMPSKNTAFPTYMVDIYEVDVPADVEEGRYCFTPSDGFYLNPEWNIEVSAEVEQTIIESVLQEVSEYGY